MPSVQVEQFRRQVILPSGLARYEVVTHVVDSGDLPFPQLFVVTIVDPANPMSDVLARIATPRDLLADADILYVKVDSGDLRVIAGDTFARVASVSDITGLHRDRTDAVRAGATEFLTTTFTMLYETLPTASAAYRTILDRVSLLALEYRQYRDTFSTHPSRTYLLPQAALSVEAEYTAAYRDKKTATKAARTVRDTAATARQACLDQGAGDRAIVDFLATDIAFLERAKQNVTGMVETGALVGGVYTVAPTISFNNVVKTYVLNGADASSYEALLVQKRAAYAVKRAALVASDDACRALADSLVDAERALANAQRDEDAALGRLLVVCPTFDPNSVIV